MKQIAAGLFFILAANAAYADECIALWIERNGYYDRAGYCFRSELGQRYFDNSNCTTSTASVSDSAMRRVNAIRSREQQLGCDAQKSQWTISEVVNGVRSQTNRAVSRNCATTDTSLVGWFITLQQCGDENASDYFDCLARVQNDLCDINNATGG